MKGKTILVCDDEPHIRHVVSDKLRNAGFEVATAEDGLEALDAARTLRPDLIITDNQMPELSGLELCARLRGDSTTSGIPVIMLSARSFSVGDEETRGTNILAVLPKPFSPREVLAKVNQLLGQEQAAGV